MSLLDDITSRDPERVWTSSCAIRTLRDMSQLAVLVEHLDDIKSKTRGVKLGGIARPNLSHLDFVIRKLEFIKASAGCLCTLYAMDDMYDPSAEEKAGNVSILDTVTVENYVDHYKCQCSLCGTIYQVDERQYHYTWWAWRAV